MPAYCAAINLLFFPVPKNAGTSVRHLLYELDHGQAYETPIVDGRPVELHHIYGQPTPFAPVKAPAGAVKIAIVRDPLRRLVSAYRNRVLHYGEIGARQVALYRLPPRLPPRPDFRTFVENLGEYQKIPDIAHHTTAQVNFIGRDPAYYDRIFRFEALAELEAYLSDRAGRPVALPRLRTEGPAMDETAIDDDLRRKIAARYEADAKFIGRLVPA